MTDTSNTSTTPPKPHEPAPKNARDMTPEERKKALADIRRGKLPVYVPGQ